MEFLGRLGEYFELTVTHLLSGERFYITLLFIGMIFLYEIHRKGYRLHWPRRQVESVGANVGFFLINLFLAPGVILLVLGAQKGYDLLGIPSLDQAIWGGIPAPIMILLAIFLFDLADYWSHRVMHMSWLWPVHAIHHSDPDVNGLTTYRIHFLEFFFTRVGYILLLSWMGFPASALGIGAVFVALHNIYIHIGLDWGHGPFRLLLASPRYHRWHHADVPAAHGVNFANVFPFLDVLFRTYHVPGPCTVPLGAEGVPKNNVIKLCLFPFTEYAKMVARLFRGKASSA